MLFRSLTDAQKGAVFSAFGLAYALFEIPTGWLGDKIGARKVLVRVVLWWSFFTAATGWAWNYVSLLVMRFLFGAGEAGCFPNLTKAFSAWLPSVERTRAQAIMWMGARWGGAFTPLLVVAVMSFVSWRTAFLVFALLGVAWTVVFWFWFRDNPRDHPGFNAAELELLRENEQNVQGHGPYGLLGWMWPTARGKDTPGFPVMDSMSDGVAQLNDYQVRSVVGKENCRRAQLDFGKASFPMDDYKKNLGPDGLIARTRTYMETAEWKEISAWALDRLK